ncbi:MAG: ligase-associated DNA damage response exonuclease [Cyanobacteria bacterium REEB67]|nr:ligase-associated DNA damage response exonuclease [Cyanobacteria bacterium REEB67]
MQERRSDNFDLVRVTDKGLYCQAGDFYIDPWRPVPRALITHGHSDHARSGSANYVAHRDGLGILRLRLGEEALLSGVDYGEKLSFNDVHVSFHPAGHILGSAQIRIEHKGLVAVVSGDYKTQADPTCRPLTPVKCHVFISESTFGLPIYRFPEPAVVMDEINTWWQANRQAGQVSLIYAYSLGKAQRILAGVDPAIGPIYTHGAVEALNAVYRGVGVKLAPTTYVGESSLSKSEWARSGALVVAPPNATGSAWTRKFGVTSEAFASGWMRIRGARRRRSLDKGFVLSDHADWPGLLDVIKATGAERVLITHGYTPPLVRYLNDSGIAADSLETLFVGEGDLEAKSESTDEDKAASASGQAILPDQQISAGEEASGEALR